jgi:MoxR-like ATPase
MSMDEHVRDGAALRHLAREWIKEVEGVIAGKRMVIERMVTACLCEGHVLLEDKPGVGKTTLVQALATASSCSFRRIQFTPDQLPGDITGGPVMNPRTMEMTYRPGPIMAQIVLADEINRASPKTQSALLEAMEERTVTADGETRPLPRPFMLLATQNPLRHEGTYPLPEAQLDRFLFRLAIGYPDHDEEVELLERVRLAHPIGRVRAVVSTGQLMAMQRAVRHVWVDAAIKRYIVTLADATRTHPDLELGLSPRGSISLMRGAQAAAWLDGRDYVIPDDVKSVAEPVMAHRLLPKRHAAGFEPAEWIAALLKRVAVPHAARMLRGTGGGLA